MTPSPASSDKEDATDSEPDDNEGSDSDSEPDTDKVLPREDCREEVDKDAPDKDKEEAPAEATSMPLPRDRHDPTHPQNRDFGWFQQMMRDRARK